MRVQRVHPIFSVSQCPTQSRSSVSGSCYFCHCSWRLCIMVPVHLCSVQLSDRPPDTRQHTGFCNRTVCGIVTYTLSHLKVRALSGGQGKLYFPPFTDEETQVQKGETSCTRSCSPPVVEIGFEPVPYKFTFWGLCSGCPSAQMTFCSWACWLFLIPSCPGQILCKQQ